MKIHSWYHIYTLVQSRTIDNKLLNGCVFMWFYVYFMVWRNKLNKLICFHESELAKAWAAWAFLSVWVLPGSPWSKMIKAMQDTASTDWDRLRPFDNLNPEKMMKMCVSVCAVCAVKSMGFFGSEPACLEAVASTWQSRMCSVERNSWHGSLVCGSGPDLGQPWSIELLTLQ